MTLASRTTCDRCGKSPVEPCSSTICPRPRTQAQLEELRAWIERKAPLEGDLEIGTGAPMTRPQDAEATTRTQVSELEAELFALLTRTYVQRSDDRQAAMGLQYTTAETHDLIATIAKAMLPRIQALDLALEQLVRQEPGDSRAVSNEFVAMARAQVGTADESSMAIITEALNRLRSDDCYCGGGNWSGHRNGCPENSYATPAQRVGTQGQGGAAIRSDRIDALGGYQAVFNAIAAAVKPWPSKEEFVGISVSVFDFVAALPAAPREAG